MQLNTSTLAIENIQADNQARLFMKKYRNYLQFLINTSLTSPRLDELELMRRFA